MSKILCQVLLEVLHELLQDGTGAKKKLAGIKSQEELEKLLNKTILDEEESRVVRLKSGTRKTFIEIGEELNISERTARRRYKSALGKIQANI